MIVLFLIVSFCRKGKIAQLQVPNPASTRHSNGALIVCMAQPRRVARVAKQIEREIGSLFIYDKVVQEAVCPERRRGLDGALSALASVTEVEVSNDLQVAKVFVTIYSDDVGKMAAINGLRKLEGYVRHHVGQTVRLRLTPEIRFILDESIERSERVLKLLEQTKEIQEGRSEPPPVVIGGEFYDEGPLLNEELDLNAWDERSSTSRTNNIVEHSVDLGLFQADDKSTGRRKFRKESSRRGHSKKNFQSRRKNRNDETFDSAAKNGDLEIPVEEVEAFKDLFNQRE